MLRVGANNQGLPVSYGRLTVATGVANRDVEGAYEIQDPNPDDTEYFQLCGTFETQYGLVSVGHPLLICAEIVSCSVMLYFMYM